MQDHEMKHALRRYVETDEPPFSLTASSLISRARRQRRWFSVGTSTAATLAIVSAAALAAPLLADRDAGAACDVELPLAEPVPWPPFGVGPSSWPTPFPSGYVWPDPSSNPSALPTADPSEFPTSDPTQYPTHYPTSDPTDFPTSNPTNNPSAAVAVPSTGIEPTFEPDPTAPVVDQARLHEMSCFLKRRMVELLPGWKFMGPAIAPPLEVVRDRLGYSYIAAAYVRHEGLECLITITVLPNRGDFHEPGVSHSGPETVAYVGTGASAIRVSVEGNVITDEQIKQIAGAPELDLFR